MQDPELDIKYFGEDGTLGFTTVWNSKIKNVGEGEQEVTRINEGESIEVEIRFKRPFKGNAKAVTTLKYITASQTMIKSDFYGYNKYPLNLLSLIGKRFIRKAQTQTLKNLKSLLEINN